MTRRVLRWEVEVDDNPHRIGGGKVLCVNARPQLPRSTYSPVNRVEVWTEEVMPEAGEVPMTRWVTVVGTGHVIPDKYLTYLGTAMDPNPKFNLVWHLYSL